MLYRGDDGCNINLLINFFSAGIDVAETCLVSEMAENNRIAAEGPSKYVPLFACGIDRFNDVCARNELSVVHVHHRSMDVGEEALIPFHPVVNEGNWPLVRRRRD